MASKLTFVAICAALLLGGPARAADVFPAPLPVEPTPASASLPAVYPQTWVFVHDINFGSLIDGRVAVIDVGADRRNLRAQIRAAQFGNLAEGKARRELYVAETFYSRMTRGERTDAIAVYDPASLAQTGEIVLPGGKRGQFVTQQNAFQLTDGEAVGLVFNFTPAASVTVVDLVGRKVLNEIPIPGCSLIYPTGQRGFFTLCGNGGLASIVLDAKGGIASQVDVPPFNDIDHDPMFMGPAWVKGVAYFATFHGQIRPVDASGDVARVLPAWSLVPAAQAAENWRPAGWQVVTADDDGRLYVLMQKDAHDGSHKDGGVAIWAFDVSTHQRLAEIPLRIQTASIEVTHGAQPLLVAASAAGELDVYDARSGARLRTLAGNIVNSPTVMQAVR